MVLKKVLFWNQYRSQGIGNKIFFIILQLTIIFIVDLSDEFPQ